jgi:hypothetical protein
MTGSGRQAAPFAVIAIALGPAGEGLTEYRERHNIVLVVKLPARPPEFFFDYEHEYRPPGRTEHEHEETARGTAGNDTRGIFLTTKHTK